MCLLIAIISMLRLQKCKFYIFIPLKNVSPVGATGNSVGRCTWCSHKLPPASRSWLSWTTSWTFLPLLGILDFNGVWVCNCCSRKCLRPWLMSNIGKWLKNYFNFLIGFKHCCSYFSQVPAMMMFGWKVCLDNLRGSQFLCIGGPTQKFWLFSL